MYMLAVAGLYLDCLGNAKTSLSGCKSAFYLSKIKNSTTGEPPQHIRQNRNCSLKNTK